METQADLYRDLMQQGFTALQIATNCGVTEPHVRKKLRIPNPHCSLDSQRKIDHLEVINDISLEIHALYETRFITPDHTSEFIESLITMSDSRSILELGMYSGFTTLHMIRAIIGKPGAKVVSIDARPAHDPDFFARHDIAPWFEFIHDWTPQCLTQLSDRTFDLVFIDSDHTISHTDTEIAALWPITRSGTIFIFHDAPKVSPVYGWLESKVADGVFKGLILPTAPQADVSALFGDDPNQRPNLGVFMRP